MLPNEKFALECRARYEAIGLVVDERNGEFAHCPFPKGMGETGYYLLHGDHQHQGLLQSRDVGKLCFFSGDAKRWLTHCDPFPKDYFSLYDIYDKYSSENSRKNCQKLHSEKDELGRSVLGVQNAERLNKKLHAEKDENGRSLHAIKANQILHSVKDEHGRSKVAVKAGKIGGKKGGKIVHKEKDAQGRSVLGVRNAERLNAQVWESTVDGFRGRANSVAIHNKANGWNPAARTRIA